MCVSRTHRVSYQLTNQCIANANTRPCPALPWPRVELSWPALHCHTLPCLQPARREPAGQGSIVPEGKGILCLGGYGSAIMAFTACSIARPGHVLFSRYLLDVGTSFSVGCQCRQRQSAGRHATMMCQTALHSARMLPSCTSWLMRLSEPLRGWKALSCTGRVCVCLPCHPGWFNTTGVLRLLSALLLCCKAATPVPMSPGLPGGLLSSAEPIIGRLQLSSTCVVAGLLCFVLDGVDAALQWTAGSCQHSLRWCLVASHSRVVCHRGPEPLCRRSQL